MWWPRIVASRPPSPRMTRAAATMGGDADGGTPSTGCRGSPCRRWCCTGPRIGSIAPGNAELLARRIPGAELRLLEGAGHVFWSEQPELADRPDPRLHRETPRCLRRPRSSCGWGSSARRRALRRTSGRPTRSVTGSRRPAGRWWTSPTARSAWSPVAAEQERPLAPADVTSVLEEPATMDVSVHWVCEGWPEDVDRAIAAFRAHAGGRRAQYVVADVTGEPVDRWGDDVEVLGSGAGDGLGVRAERRSPAFARPHRAGDGRFGRADGRRVRPPRRSARRSEARRLRPVRHRDHGPAPVRRGARRRSVRRDRGLPDGLPSRDARRGGFLRREVQVVPDRGHRVVVPRQGRGVPLRGGRAPRREARAPDVVRERPRASGPSGRSGTSTGSWTDGATGGIWCLSGKPIERTDGRDDERT